MKIKKQYEMNDDAWIHIGDGKLTKGKVIDIFDLEHAGYSKDMEFYIIAIPTAIEDLLEVRTWEQMSQDAKGPIGSYREIKQGFATKKYLGKVGITVPTESQPIKEDDAMNNPLIDDDLGIKDPTPEEVNAAIERAEQQRNQIFRPQVVEKPKRFYGKRKK
jgi:hypothetical protein